MMFDFFCVIRVCQGDSSSHQRHLKEYFSFMFSSLVLFSIHIMCYFALHRRRYVIEERMRCYCQRIVLTGAYMAWAHLFRQTPKDTQDIRLKKLNKGVSGRVSSKEFA